MSILKLKGSTSGYVELTAPATAGNNTITLPTTAGTVAVKDASNNTEVGTGVTIGSPSSNVFTVSTNGSEVVRVGAAGSVGIGTNNPTQKLEVFVNRTSSTNATSIVLNDNVTGAQTNGVYKAIRSLSNNGASVSEIRFVETDGTNNNTAIVLATQSTAGALTERFRVHRDGNIGIGTSNPNELLEVRGTENQGIRLTSTASSGEGANLQWYSEQTGDNKITAEIESDGESTGGNLFFKTRSTGGVLTSRVKIDNNGYVTIYKDTSNLSRLQFEAASTRIEYSDASGHLSFYTNSSARVRVNYLGGFSPVTDNSQSLGTSSERWTAVYAVNGTIQTSDFREKTNVSTSSLGTDFIKQLRPVSYKFKVGENVVTKDEDGETDIVTQRPGERTHWGFIAQEVKEVVDAAGVDFGGWILTDKDDPDSTQGLRYDQFIAPLTKALQEAIAKIETLEAENATLKNDFTALAARVTALESA